MFGAKRRAAAVAKAAEELIKRPICGCGHHWSHHDGKGTCHFVTLETVETEVAERDTRGQARVDRFSNLITSTEVRVVRSPCTCQRYYGPEPHPEYIVPPLAEIE